MNHQREILLRRLSYGCMAIGLILALTAVMRKSVTIDEFQALPSGIAILQTGDFGYSYGTPPLSQVLPAFPSYLTGARIEPVSEGVYRNWSVAHAFAEKNPSSFHFHFLLARIFSAFVLFAVFYFTYIYAHRLFGASGALLALIVASFCPNLLAHGPLVTPDIYLAGGIVAFLLCLDFFQERASWQRAGLLGIALGLANLAKFTGILLFPLLPLCLWFLGMRRDQIVKGTAVTWSIAFFTIHLGYGFQGSFSIFPWLFPGPFLEGLRQQLREPPYYAYLLGEFNSRGFFSYYLIGLLVKSQPAALLLSLFACARRPSRRELPLIFCAVALFLFFSFARQKNIGLRYVLFLYPILAIWIGRIALFSYPWKKALLVFSCASLILSCLWQWPNYLPYFNQIAGGSENGHRYLIDSNLDWGQDLSTLKEYMLDHQIEVVGLAHFGRVSPALYGINFTKLSPESRERFVAISANFLWGYPFFQNGLPEPPASMEFLASFRKRRPVAILGYSIYLYDRESF